jgi:shikimate dehydrogenase
VRLILLGDPVGHSLSPVIQRAALDAAGVAGSYTTRRVDEAGLADAVTEIRRGELDGANVTMPHKRLAATLVDELAPDAQHAGAVNTIVRKLQRLVGHLTDVAGVRDAGEEAGLPAAGPVLVLGAGGAAAAAILAVDGRPLRVAARRPGAARELMQTLEVDGEDVEWGAPWPDATVINATPIGMSGDRLPPGIVEEAAALLDMAYCGGPTPAVAVARAGGIPVADGLDMLIAQGATSFTLWTQLEAPRNAMRAALHHHRKS